MVALWLHLLCAVRPARVASLGVAVATVVVSSVFLVGGFDNLGGNGNDAAGAAGDIQGVARGLQLSPKQAKSAQQLGSIALSLTF